ncbi:MAG: endonuclease domain-containing protein [Actinobacteria bacterium]|nr:endonuclease domain-containing protein [Actinomycetota bacterium]
MSGRRTFFDDVDGLRQLAERQVNVVRRDQLRALDVTSHHIRRQVDARRWRLLGPNVVVLTNGELSRRQWMQVGVCHVGRRGALDGWTRLELAGLAGWDRPGVHLVTVHGRREPAPPGLVVHQSRRLDAVDVEEGPLRCVTVARAAIDAAGWLPSPRAACGLLLAVAQQRLATPGDMLDVLERIWRVRHTAVLRETLVEAIGGAESHSEIDVMAMMRSAGFRHIRRQVRIDTPEESMRVDLLAALPDGRLLVVEVDGPSHEDPAQRERDARRDAALIALGYVVLHIPTSLLRTDPHAVIRQLIAIRQQRSAA